ncbi:J domain-containing protein [Nocardioides guangzhouensis]|uniref:J domain-containing protein n=1 Tax=Nocardioides guangzhouensis TaxID=2497878 RepID=A0A4Q4Z7A3_9ACTN|nr:J domain-containing protein [Nocardioides guangzhouensis]RYP82936.1 J domain-containing protein [Nocardioides guangzhouensis]
MSATWYDVLGVEETATTEQIRTAWRESIADLDPGDRRFRLYNEAAEVLLDDERRTAYDAELAAAGVSGDDEARTEAAATSPSAADAAATGQADDCGDEPADDAATEPARVPATAGAGRTLPWVPGWLLAGLAVMVLLVTLTAAYLQVTGSDAVAADDAADEATAAARTSVPLVFTYDYRYPDRDKDRALRVLTGDLKAQYDELWSKAIGPNLEKSKGYAKTTSSTAGVACVSDDGQRVGVLVVLDSEAGNVKQTQKLTLSFTATMVQREGDWLIEKIDGWDPREISAAADGQTPSGDTSTAAPEDGSDASGASDCAAD